MTAQVDPPGRPKDWADRSIKPDRNLDAEASIICHELAILVHRIEMLQAHPHYTNALTLVQKAFLEMGEGRSEIHQSEMAARLSCK